MNMKVNRLKVFPCIIVTILCFFSAFSSGVYVIFQNSIIRIGVLIFAFLLIILQIILQISRHPKFLTKVDILLILAIIVNLLNNNYELKHQSSVALAIQYVMGLLLIIMLEHEKYGDGICSISLNILEKIYAIHVICTIWFYFDGNFYLNRILPLYPNDSYKLQYFYKNGWMAGLLNHYSSNGMVLAVMTIILFSNWISDNRKKNVINIMLLLSIVALLLTGKRAHILFTAAACYIVFWQHSEKKGRLVKAIGAIILLSIVVIIAYQLFPFLFSFVDRFISASDNGDVTLGRLMFWDLAIDIFQRNILFGIGWSQFQSYLLSTTGIQNHVHNVYIQLLAETGVIGAIIYYIFFLFFYVNSFLVYKEMKNNPNGSYRTLSAYSLCIQTFFLLYCITGNPLYSREMYIPYFIGCAITLIFSKKMHSKDMNSKSKCSEQKETHLRLNYFAD